MQENDIIREEALDLKKMQELILIKMKEIEEISIILSQKFIIK